MPRFSSSHISLRTPTCDLPEAAGDLRTLLWARLDSPLVLAFDLLVPIASFWMQVLFAISLCMHQISKLGESTMQ